MPRSKSASADRVAVREVTKNRAPSMQRPSARRPRKLVPPDSKVSVARRSEMHARLAAIVECSLDAIISAAPDGTILTWNLGAEHLFGYTAAEVCGVNVSSLVPQDRLHELTRRQAMILAGERMLPYQTERIAKGGRRVAVSISASPLTDTTGAVIGIALIFRDASELQRVQLRLERQVRISGLMEALARAANEATSARTAMQSCLERIAEFDRWTLGRIATFASGQRLGAPEPSIWHCPESTRFAEFIKVSDLYRYSGRTSGQFVSEALRDGKPVWVADLLTAPGFGRHAAASRCGLRAGFVFPVIAAGETLAFLEFFADAVREPDATFLEAIGGIAAQLARLIERVRADATRTQLATIVESSDYAIISRDLDRRIVTWNAAAERLFGYSAAEAIGQSVSLIVPCDQAAQVALNSETVASGIAIPTTDVVRRTKAGRRIDVSITQSPIKGPSGEVTGVSLIFREITRRKQSESRREMEHAITRVLAEADTLADAIPAIIQTICTKLQWHCGARWALDTDSGLLRCYESWQVDSTEIRQFAAENSQRTLQPVVEGHQGMVRRAFRTGEPVWIANLARDRTFTRAALAAKSNLKAGFCFPLLLGESVLGVLEFFHRDVQEPDELLIAAVHSIGSQIGQYTVRKQAEESLQFVAKHDTLTGLPNRMMLHDRLELAIVRAQRSHRRLAVMFIDLDRFKAINDTLGHDAGDLLLCEVAKRLSGALRASDTAARLGGDEFVVMIDEISDPIHLGAIAQKLIGALTASVQLCGQECHVSASIGISTYPEDAQDRQALLRNADVAMYRAKEQGRNGYQFYTPQMNVHSSERLKLETGLRGALEREELLLHYQPRVDTRTGCFTGVEALLRWQHPELGLVPPVKFIALAEETGLIVPIGEWVLQAACAQSRAWAQMGLAQLRVAINLSARQFAQQDLLITLERIIKHSGCNPDNLDLEITESMVMHDPEGAIAVMRRMKDLGTHIALDDFGTGYSSLAHLKRFPVDCLKIDRSFIMDIPQDAGGVAITLAIITMAHSLGMTVTAEGVETRAQFDFLRDRGCDELQGYYFSKPLPEAPATALLLTPIAAHDAAAT